MKLKPCPFCGGKAILETCGGHEFFIKCEKCSINQDKLYGQKCDAEIWVEALGGRLKDLRQTDTREINAVMSRLTDWRRSDNPLRCGPYSRQRSYMKVGKTGNT